MEGKSIQFHQILILLIFCCGLNSEARNWRSGQIPNGFQNNCSNCHFRSSGGGARTSFGEAVNARVDRKSRAEFWNAALAALDSDDDGFTNGEELGDPDGDGVPIPGAQVTHPGDPNSFPELQNTSPSVSSDPVTTADFGIDYQYQVTASDPEGDPLTYQLTLGPDWLSVSNTGLVQGIPPEDTVGVFPVTITITDTGTPAESIDQSFDLTVKASFDGWRALRFPEPSDDNVSGAKADPDGDGRSNLLEYLLLSDPSIFDGESFVSIVVGPSGRMRLQLSVRDNDPQFTIQVVASSNVKFSGAETLELEESDPHPEDGLKTLTFRDTIANPVSGSRFARIGIVDSN